MTHSIPFWKYQSIGNDFPIVHLADVEAVRGAFDPSQIPHEDRSEAYCKSESAVEDILFKLAVAICDRHFGVGGDGLLVASPREDGAVDLRMFNPDGTEDFCGNGLRCAAIHARDQEWVGDAFTLLHRGREVLTVFEDGRVRTKIGHADYRPAAVPLRPDSGEIFRNVVFADAEREIFGSALTTGSTHVIVPVENLPEDEGFETVSRAIEHYPLYPERTSVIWTQEVAPNHLRVRIWERGVGETEGCGTGSSAAAADYFRSVEGSGTVQVDNPGGTVWVSMDRWDSLIEVVGTAERVYQGEYRFEYSSSPEVGGTEPD